MPPHNVAAEFGRDRARLRYSPFFNSDEGWPTFTSMEEPAIVKMRQEFAKPHAKQALNDACKALGLCD